ncbi:MAG TPA: epoxyqueuosine reductase QueH [Hydrogenispora sp.]|nr:epoxyqueuosine reductase QueH [Hydrogenispora sp.]
MELLLHTCCGPCATYSTEFLQEQGYVPTMYYYNPNIHPYKEWQRRKESLEKLAVLKKLPLVLEEAYELSAFLQRTVPYENERCGICYRMRLEQTARQAQAMGIPAFGTTLLISPYQNRDLICQIGNELAAVYNLSFCDLDLRPGFRRSQQLARDYELYRQGYCGCIFSERDRYYKPKGSRTIKANDYVKSPWKEGGRSDD